MKNIFQSVGMKKPRKNKFDLSHEKKMSMKMNNLYPIMMQEIVPGDKFRVKSEVLIRLAPMLAPVMHRMNVTTHYFFVPNRLVWSEWEDFITGGEDGNSAPPFPYLNVTTDVQDYFVKGGLPDYFGIPPIDPLTTPAIKQISAIPFRAYQLIFNEYYRDQNVQEKIEVPKGSGQQTNADTRTVTTMRTRAWEKDYFTSALPWSQRGGEATIPLGNIDENDVNYLPQSEAIDTLDPTGSAGALHGTNGLLATSTGDPVQLKNIESIDVNATTINDLRKANRLQEWLERSARGGSRYIEQIFSHFGVKSSDARLQRPEFLGGGRQPVVISEVLSTYSATDMGVPSANPQGDMSGHGISVGQSNGFSKSFEEHGYVIGIMSVIPKTAYQNGVERTWFKFDKFSYYWPEFANLGEQEILNKELYMDWSDVAGVNEETFGYQQRYAEYKYQQSSVHGDFRDNLKYWHMGRIFDNLPTLSEQFITADADKRIFAVEDEDTDELYVQIYNKVDALRPMPYFSIPTL